MPNPDEISTKLLEDFDPALIEIKSDKGNQRYIGHEHIRMRLIEATGNQFDFRIDSVEYRDDGALREKQDNRTGEVRTPLTCVVTGTLTIPGLGSRTDVGVQEIQHGGGADSAYKGAVSDALKRCAMNFGVGLRQLYMGENVQTQQQTARATTSPKPVRQQAPKPKPEEINDKEFDDLVRAALATKDGGEYIRLVEAYAGKYTSRWIVLVRNCESEQGLDWIEKKAERMGIESAGLPIAIANRRAELTGALEGTNE